MKLFIANYSEHKMTKLMEYLSKIEELEIVGHTSSALDAIQAIRELQPDVVILYVGLMGLVMGSGVGVLIYIRYSNLPVNVIMIADDNCRQYETWCLEEKADHFFSGSEINQIELLFQDWRQKK